MAAWKKQFFSGGVMYWAAEDRKRYYIRIMKSGESAFWMTEPILRDDSFNMTGEKGIDFENNAYKFNGTPVEENNLNWPMMPGELEEFYRVCRRTSISL